MKVLRKLSGWLRKKMRTWLGLGDIFMGVDVGMRDQSCIVIVSRAGTGYVKIIRTYFPNMMEVDRMVRELQARYGIKELDTIFDAPRGSRLP